MVQFKVNRGNESDLPILLTDGWVYFCTDTGNVYFDWQDGENVRRTQMNAKYADIIRYHDGSDYIDIDPAEIALKNDIPKIDNTLTADGQAADAKTVGDELNKKISAPSTASVGQALRVKTVDENGMPTEWETADVSETGTASIDPTLTQEGSAADAKAVGDALKNAAAYTNVADTSSEDWASDSRLTADCEIEDCARCCVTNWIECRPGDVIRIYGIDLFDKVSGKICTYNSFVGAYETAACASYADHFPVKDGITAFTVYSFNPDLESDWCDKVRFSGLLTAESYDAVIITVNQEISEFATRKFVEEAVAKVKVETDPTLTKEGFAADAKAVGEELGKKALKTLYVEPINESVSTDGHEPPYFPALKANHTTQEIYDWFLKGGHVKLCYWGRTLDLVYCSEDGASFEMVRGGEESEFWRASVYGDDRGIFIYRETPGYIRNNFSATVGQTIVVDAVDENGKPTAWKAVDMASSTPKEKTLQVTIEFVRGAYIASHSLAQIREYKESGWKITARYMYNTELELEELGDYSARFEKLYMLQYGSDHFELKYEQITINNGDDRCAYYSNYSRNLTAIDFVASGDKRYVTGGAVYDYAVPIPATAEVGQVLSVKAVDDNGKPIEWEPVDMSGGGAVELDATLSVEGAAADAKATGDALAGKANKTLHVELTWDNTNGVDIPSHSSQEIYEYVVNGGDAEVLWNGYIHKIDSYSPTSCIFVNHGIGFNGNTYTYQISSVQIYDGKTVGKSSNNYFAVDSALSETSNNAVRNSVITKALAEKAPNTLFVNGIWDSTAGKAYSDVSYNEILAHYNAGGRVFLTYSGSIMELTEAGKYGANYAVFEKIELDSVGGMLYRRWAFIYDTDEVEWDSRSFNVGTDSELNYYSSNSVQNKVITAALAQKSQVQIITWEDDD